MKIVTNKHLEEIKKRGLTSLYDNNKIKVSVGMATCGLATGAQKVYDALKRVVEKEKLDIVVRQTGCIGFCQKEPIVDVMAPGKPRLIYSEMTAEKAEQLAKAFIKGEIYKENLLCKIEEEEILIEDIKRTYHTSGSPELKNIPAINNIPFFAKQKKIVLRNCGFINPESIEEYIARGGYIALHKAVTSLTPEKVIDIIKKSGLRGRGGAGFPTGKKWEFCRKAQGDIKYIICNADEGDPGAYMDRSVLEGDPHTVLEGMIIGAYAIGAVKGYIYVRSEYPLAIRKLNSAIEQAREYGLLGDNIFNSGFSFDIRIIKGAGAFVCGEETSLIASIEGRPAEPRQRPPFPAQSGLWGKPTNINNVETWANVPFIIVRGSDYFSNIGTANNSGTKVFSLVGKVKNNGLVEVPIGIPLKDIIYGIGEGIPGGKRYKAVQTGGPSGGCVPDSLINIPVDYEKLKDAGSIMGSGGMVVMDEDNCAVDIAKFFLEFTQSESCGKCTSCREGSGALLEVLTRITEGEGLDGDIEFLEELSYAIKDSSLCGLGQTLPNPVLSTLKYYRDEYEVHIKEKRCPAVVCKKIISSPCQHTCPLEQDVPCYIGLIAQGKFKEAFEIVLKENPFPSICGRVCHNPCESKCRSGVGGDPIAIRSLKRFLADYARKKEIYIDPKPKKKREEKIAIIGSGPAGLSCAYYLALKGYRVTVFESLSKPGGMLHVGIPEYRLPRDIIDYEIKRIEKLGVIIKTNSTVGKDILLNDLKNEYKAIFFATGAHENIKINLPGENTDGVIDAIKFLKDVNSGKIPAIGKRVIVIGGGNAAIDAARVVKRLGKDVKILYRRTREEMPAIKSEVDEAIHEGIDINFLMSPSKILSNGGKIKSIECIKMKLGDIDESGRRRPIPIEGSEFTIELDTIIFAIGQKPDVSYLAEDGELQITKWNTIKVDHETLQTKVDGIFAGGDVVSGPANVVDAIAHGKIAAKMIDKYINGQKIARDYHVTRPAIKVEPVVLSEEEIENLSRPVMPVLSLSKRLKSFKEVELGFSEEQAIREAKRCLRCDLELEKDIGV
jgi:NADH-quinone oxidoreductase subunit F